NWSNAVALRVITTKGRVWGISHVEILGLGVVGDDGIGALLGGEHEVFGEGDADFFGFEDLSDECAVFEVGAGWVAEGIAAAAVGLLEDLGDAGGIFGPEAEFLAHPLVPELGQGLGGF